MLGHHMNLSLFLGFKTETKTENTITLIIVKANNRLSSSVLRTYC